MQAEDGDQRAVKSRIRYAALQTIGNLTILTQALTAAVSNGPWKQKRPELLSHSLLPINLQLRNAEVLPSKYRVREDGLQKGACYEIEFRGASSSFGTKAEGVRSRGTASPSLITDDSRLIRPIDRKLKAIDVIDVLSGLFILRGVPGHIRSDNVLRREWWASGEPEVSLH